MEGGPRTELRCWQKVAVDSESQCFCIAVLFDWGVTTSIMTQAAAAALELHSPRHLGLCGKMAQSKVMYVVPLVARNGDINTVSAWEEGKLPLSQAAIRPKT
jgi:hypothetical protein